MDTKAVEKYLVEKGAKFYKNYPMRKFVSIKVGGIADILYFPSSIEELSNFLRNFKEFKNRIYLLGSGTNVVIRDGGIRGVVISTKDLKGINVDNNKNNYLIEVLSGEPLASLVKMGMKIGLKGIEKLAGIPGTIGGAVMGNAGLDRKGISEFVEMVEIVTYSGRRRSFQKSELVFEYRKLKLPVKGIIVKVHLSFKRGNPEMIRRKVIEKIKEKALSQPLTYPSAGSIFKNPPGRKAWKLIDDAGLRGLRLGGIRVSTKHANFLIKEGEATAEDVETLVDLIKLRVKRIFGIELEEEIKFIGEKKNER